jgi:hypothetical protein
VALVLYVILLLNLVKGWCLEIELGNLISVIIIGMGDMDRW